MNHLGSVEVKIGVEVKDPNRGSNTVIGYTKFIICVACAKPLGLRAQMDPRLDVAPLREPLYALLAAHLVADALMEKP